MRIGGRAHFLKTNEASFADALAAEADGLVALAKNGLRTPVVVCHGLVGDEAFLLLEFLPLGGAAHFAALGRALAAAHARPGERFGWARDNYIGATPQENGWDDDWARFFRMRRLAPQLALAKCNGYALAMPQVDALLKNHHPCPSLLHGDLWSGNVGFTDGAAVVFDPAVYYGDAEADLAMTELFGGFPAAFYEAYAGSLPLRPGYATRKHLYNLYHLLNHLNLFGGGYLGQVQATLRLLRDVLQ